MTLSPVIFALASALAGVFVSVAAGCASFYAGDGDDITRDALSLSRRYDAGFETLGARDAAELAVRNSYELEGEYAALRLREGAWRLGLRAYLPRLNLSASSDERLSVTDVDSTTKTIALSLEQPLWDGGRVSASRALERADIALAASELDRTARETGEAAVTAYRSVVAARARLRIKDRSFASALAEKAVLETEIRLGLALESDLVTVALGLAGMEIEIAEAELSVDMAESELAEALGTKALPALSERLELDRPAMRLSADRVADAAGIMSPELGRARHALLKARAESRAASFAWLPSVGIQASGYASGDSFPLTRGSWTVGLTVDFSSPLLNGEAGATAGKTPPFDTQAATSLSVEPFPDPAGVVSARVAALALGIERERYLATLSGIGRSARVAVTEYDNAVRKRDISVKALALAEEKLALASLRGDMGLSLRSETLEAEMERATREVDLVDAAAAMLEAERGIEKLLDLPPGGLEGFLAATLPATPAPIRRNTGRHET